MVGDADQLRQREALECAVYFEGLYAVCRPHGRMLAYRPGIIEIAAPGVQRWPIQSGTWEQAGLPERVREFAVKALL